MLLVAALAASALVHLRYVPRHFPADLFRAVPFLLAGWVTFGLACYAAGRLAPGFDTLPNMRTADVGVGLLIVSLLLAVGLDTLGFGPEAVPVAYVLPAVGFYLGLALAGWAFGRRTTAVDRIADREAT